MEILFKIAIWIFVITMILPVAINAIVMIGGLLAVIFGSKD